MFQVQSIKLELTNYLFSFNPLHSLNTKTRSYLFPSFYLQRFSQSFAVCIHSSNILNIFCKEFVQEYAPTEKVVEIGSSKLPI